MKSYITLMTKDSYLPFTVALWDSWKKVESKYPFVVAIDNQITEGCKNKMKELGIELEVLFSALKNGVYYFTSDGQLIHDYVYLISNYMDVGVHEKLSFSFKTFIENQTLLFEDYGKTWALTREELEDDN